MAVTDPLISTQDLANRLGERQLQVIDASWFLPNEARSGREEYLQVHIPAAIFFDIDAIADHTTDLPHMLPTPADFARAAGELGLSRDADIVIYDTHGIRSAARVWWTLRVMGFEKVQVLDGGLKKWLAEGRPVETGGVLVFPSVVEPRFDPELVRDREAVHGLLTSGEARLVDARPAPRFRGEVPEPRAGLRSGHMPGAASVPMDQLIGPDGTMKPRDELQTVFAQAGVDVEAPIVTTCGSGVTASVVALALARLGHDRVPVYDGSWSEWGARTDTPVVTGP